MSSTPERSAARDDLKVRLRLYQSFKVERPMSPVMTHDKSSAESRETLLEIQWLSEEAGAVVKFDGGEGQSTLKFYGDGLSSTIWMLVGISAGVTSSAALLIILQPHLMSWLRNWSDSRSITITTPEFAVCRLGENTDRNITETLRGNCRGWRTAGDAVESSGKFPSRDAVAEDVMVRVDAQELLRCQPRARDVHHGEVDASVRNRLPIFQESRSYDI